MAAQRRRRPVVREVRQDDLAIYRAAGENLHVRAESKRLDPPQWPDVSGGMKVGESWRSEIPFTSAGFSSRSSI
jgi:hypothetical protein